MAHNPTVEWSLPRRHDVEQFMHDEFFESLPLSSADVRPRRPDRCRSGHVRPPPDDRLRVRTARPRPPPTADGHATRAPWRSTARDPTLRRSSARQPAGPQARRSFRQRSRPRARAGRRPDDRVPHEGHPGSRPGVDASVAVDRRHPDPDTTHLPRRGDPRRCAVARTGARCARYGRRDCRPRELVDRICARCDLRADDRSRGMATSARRVPGHGPRDDRDVFEPRHLLALRLGPPGR